MKYDKEAQEDHGVRSRG